ncbi:hypothetical protein KKC91_06065 [bacterium]|nr:hypothetical protein [bacterium]
MKEKDNCAHIKLRPYQVLCIVCSVGEGKYSGLKDKKVKQVLDIIRKNPNTPVTLQCNVSSIYKYQNPGANNNSSEGTLYNIKRDLDIFQKLGLAPGATLPARELFIRLLKEIKTVTGICTYDDITSRAWKGCSKAKNGYYEKVLKKGISEIIPDRGKDEKSKVKKESANNIYSAKKLFIRPHHLMCVTCFLGRGFTSPIKEDNLYEVLDVVCNSPDIPITLTEGCCMICPPCSGYEPMTNLCVAGCGLRDEKKDLDVLQKLGLVYGVTMNAREIYRLLFERILTGAEICGYGNRDTTSPEWTICSGVKDKAYEKGREMLIKKLACSKTNRKYKMSGINEE